MYWGAARLTTTQNSPTRRVGGPTGASTFALAHDGLALGDFSGYSQCIVGFTLAMARTLAI